MSNIDSTPEFVRETYRKMDEKLAQIRARLNRPLTMSEKAAALSPGRRGRRRSAPWRQLHQTCGPDRVGAPGRDRPKWPFLQFMQSGREKSGRAYDRCTATTWSRPASGASSDLQDALNESNEVYQFLESASRRFRHGLLAARFGHHPPGGAGKVRLPRRADHRHRLPHR